MKILKPLKSSLLASVLVVLLSLQFVFFLPGPAQALVDTSIYPAVSCLRAELTEDQPYPRIHVTWDMVSAWKTYVDLYNRSNGLWIKEQYQYVNEATLYAGSTEGIIDAYVYYQLGHDKNLSQKAHITVDYSRPKSAPVNPLVSNINWNGEATLSWFDYNTNETKWMVEIRRLEDNQMIKRIELPPQDGMVNVPITGLESEHSYSFKVWAQRGGFTGPNEKVTAIIPMQPLSGLKGTYLPSDELPAVKLTWNPNYYYHKDAIEILRTNPDGSETRIENTQYDDCWPDMQIEANKIYKYRIRAINKTEPGYNSPCTEQITVSTMNMSTNINPAVSLLAPTELQAEAKSSVRIDLTWKDRALTETGFAIERTGPDDSIAALVAPKNATSYSDTGLLPGSTYTYRVKAVKDSSSSGYSNTASATTLSCSPEAIQVLINGKLLEMDVNPLVENGRTLVPLRGIFEGLGASVEWDGVAQKITAKRGDVTILLQIGSSQGFVNGKAVTLDAAPKISGGRTLVPMRFISEALGDEVKWDGGTRTASIVSSFKKPLVESPGGSISTPVKMTYSLNLEPEAISLGSTDIVEFMGSLKASISGASAQSGLSGKTVTLYRVADSGQRTQIGTATTGSGGSFEFKYKPSASGTYIAVYKNASGQDLAVSNESVVTVKSSTIIKPGTTVIPNLPNDDDDDITIDPKTIIKLK